MATPICPLMSTPDKKVERSHECALNANGICAIKLGALNISNVSQAIYSK